MSAPDLNTQLTDQQNNNALSENADSASQPFNWYDTMQDWRQDHDQESFNSNCSSSFMAENVPDTEESTDTEVLAEYEAAQDPAAKIIQDNAGLAQDWHDIIVAARAGNSEAAKTLINNQLVSDMERIVSDRLDLVSNDASIDQATKDAAEKQSLNFFKGDSGLAQKLLQLDLLTGGRLINAEMRRLLTTAKLLSGDQSALLDHLVLQAQQANPAAAPPLTDIQTREAVFTALQKATPAVPAPPAPPPPIGEELKKLYIAVKENLQNLCLDDDQREQFLIDAVPPDQPEQKELFEQQKLVSAEPWNNADQINLQSNFDQARDLLENTSIQAKVEEPEQPVDPNAQQQIDELKTPKTVTPSLLQRRIAAVGGTLSPINQSGIDWVTNNPITRMVTNHPTIAGGALLAALIAGKNYGRLYPKLAVEMSTLGAGPLVAATYAMGAVDQMTGGDPYMKVCASLITYGALNRYVAWPLHKWWWRGDTGPAGFKLWANEHLPKWITQGAAKIPWPWQDDRPGRPTGTSTNPMIVAGGTATLLTALGQPAQAGQTGNDLRHIEPPAPVVRQISPDDISADTPYRIPHHLTNNRGFSDTATPLIARTSNVESSMPSSSRPLALPIQNTGGQHAHIPARLTPGALGEQTPQEIARRSAETSEGRDRSSGEQQRPAAPSRLSPSEGMTTVNQRTVRGAIEARRSGSPPSLERNPGRIMDVAKSPFTVAGAATTVTLGVGMAFAKANENAKPNNKIEPRAQRGRAKSKSESQSDSNANK